MYYLKSTDDGPFGLIERAMLKELYDTHGARWSRIASLLGRHPRMVKDMWEQMQMEQEIIKTQMAIARLLR